MNHESRCEIKTIIYKPRDLTNSIIFNALFQFYMVLFAGSNSANMVQIISEVIINIFG